jgi:hypothetical protein
MAAKSEPNQPNPELQNRQTALNEVATLPAEALTELLLFIRYLQYRFSVVTSSTMTEMSAKKETSTNFASESPATFLAEIAELPEEKTGLQFMGNEQDESVYTY